MREINNTQYQEIRGKIRKKSKKYKKNDKKSKKWVHHVKEHVWEWGGSQKEKEKY